jgi:hypothetical protein
MLRPAGWRGPAGLVALTLAACVSASTYDPAVQKDIDRRVAALPSPAQAQTFPPPDAPGPPPVTVGAWTQHKLVDDQGHPSFVTMKVVGEEFGSYWLEIAQESYLGRTLTKMLVYFGDRSTASTVEIRSLRTRGPTGKVAEASADDLAEARTRWQGLLATLAAAWRGLRQEDTSVPAGTFSACYLREGGPAPLADAPGASRVWSHPMVPLTGVVRAQGLDRPLTMELVAFGEHGARSEMQ